jgi:hypothetical protein
MLADCTLCEHKEDPRWGLMTKGGDYYPLCDGCAPHPGDPVDCKRVADKCRELGPPFGNTVVVPRFGCTESLLPIGEDSERKGT